jgi:hypothetical protein
MRKDVCNYKEEGFLQVEGGRVSASRRRKVIYN